MASLGVLATGTAASAASGAAGAAYNGACGTGYGVVNSAPIGNKGKVYLTYSSATGKNCVVTVRAAAGAPVRMAAWVQLVEEHESTPVVDSGTYGTYAGPVYLDAKGRCVNWGGAIENQDVTVNKSNCGTFAKTAR
ncbi:spore-associated protein A [Streptomyces sp. NPDC050617]|uniref:spore-associated protein A n=1 Tax=Streptomyces sp. NPDC050617 TaxID=3154628 RepID=UPI00344326D8